MRSILAARSDFSIGESTLAVQDIIAEASRLGETAVGLTDTMSITGMVDFTKHSLTNGIKPIIGCRLRLVDDDALSWRKTADAKKAPPEYYVTWYVLSQRGMEALFRLLTRAFDDDHFYRVPKLAFVDLFDALRNVTMDDVIIATESAHSVVRHVRAHDIVHELSRCSVKLYLTLTAIDSPYFDTMNKRAIEIARDLDLPMILTRPSLYKEGDADAHEVMGALTSRTRVSDPWHASAWQRDLHPVDADTLRKMAFDAAARLRDRFGIDATDDFRSALIETDALVHAVNYEWSKRDVTLPKLVSNEFAEVQRQCVIGWRQRFSRPYFGHAPSPVEQRNVYAPRLRHELKVLKELGFAGYFLLVQDMVKWAKQNDIIVGPGRGSVGGSLVAYLMGITECDPVRFDLLFERFINPDRVDLPDIDLDFQSSRRSEVFEYLVQKYGVDRVAGIANFSTLHGPSALRDTGRTLGLAEEDYSCSKFVPRVHGQPIGLEQAAEEVVEVANFRDQYKPIWNMALTLDGRLRNLSQHAAGVVIGGVDLVERAVVERREGSRVVNWDKKLVEDQGLVKVDVLGLSTLDHIAQTISYVAARYGKTPDLTKVDVADPKVLNNFAKGNTLGVFQFESGGIRKLLCELGRDGALTFDDVVAASALYRPGPMDSGMMENYWRRKQGLEPVTHEHPLLADITRDTLGVLVYQEQIQQIAKKLCGFSAGESDVLRKAVGKKDSVLLADQKDKFINGAKAGFVSVELEDGTTRVVHRSRRFAVKENSNKWTIEEVFANGFDINEVI